MNKNDAVEKQKEIELLGPQYFCPHIKDMCRKDCKYIEKPRVHEEYLGLDTSLTPTFSETDFVVSGWDCGWGK